MRKLCTMSLVAAVAVAAASLTGAALHAGDDDDAENSKVEKEALDKAVERGKELFRSGQIAKKSCATCHENPDKPNLNLASRDFAYPKYSRKKKSVVSLGQKVNEMLTAKSGAAKEMDLNSGDVVALEAYIVSLKRK